MLQITRFDSCDPLTIVNNLGPRFNQRIKHDIAIEVDNRNPCQSITLLGQDPLTVECQYFCLSKEQKDLIKIFIEKFSLTFHAFDPD